MKDYYSEEISMSGMDTVEKVVKEEPKRCVLSHTDELSFSCEKDRETYQFNLSRIASKLPNFKTVNNDAGKIYHY